MDQTQATQIIKQGESDFALGNIFRAETCFKKVLTYNPNHIEALNNLGVTAFHQNDYDQAYEYFKKVLALDNTHQDALLNLSNCLLAKESYVEAVDLLQQAFEKGVMDTDLLNIMAQCFIRLNDPASAERILHEPLQMNHAQMDLKKWRDDLENASINHEATPQAFASTEPFNIGFVSIWFERGQAYVTKILMDALSNKHQTFILARTGGVYHQPKIETKGAWDVPNLHVHPQYDIPADVMVNWIRHNQLDAVVFNEEYDWDLVRAAKSAGARVFTYLDYYKDDWKPLMGMYDAVLCSTKRTYDLVKDLCHAHYIGWGVDTHLFRPVDDGTPKYTFFHNAGWLGINYRKMTPAVIAAFDALSKRKPDVTLFVHAQIGLEKLPPEVVDIIHHHDRITYHVETIPAPGLYHKGRILLFPSKLEGLGLPLLEGLACGLPAIVTNAPPMNEFVQHGVNGLLVRVARTIERFDHIAFPETIVDMTDMISKMSMLADHPEVVQEMSKNARVSAEKASNVLNLSERVNQVFRQCLNTKRDHSSKDLALPDTLRVKSGEAKIRRVDLQKRLQEAYILPEHIKKEIKRVTSGPNRIIFGPWLSEVGYEVLYWIPFLNWVQKAFDIEKERVTVISRGGCELWYRDLSSCYIDIFDYLSPQTFRAKNEERWARWGIQKQKGIDTFDMEIIDLMKPRWGNETYELIHPSMMVNLFMPYWESHRGLDLILDHTIYKDYPKIHPHPAWKDLTSDYFAVKFYFNSNFKDTEENRRLVSDLIHTLAKRHKIVLLDNGLDIDDHSDCVPGYSQNIYSFRKLMSAKNNLDIQTNIIARAKALIGTHGGFLGLARFYGVNAVGFYSNMYDLDSIHTPVFQSALSRFKNGSYTLLHFKDLDLIRSIVC
ncbi:MAG: tetratricopeptide repeat protein [Deltaproteobacteria bacterium]|nr:tetratricopeptide repeat protein [Deltaproteobacteria bacterium]